MSDLDTYGDQERTSHAGGGAIKVPRYTKMTIRTGQRSEYCGDDKCAHSVVISADHPAEGTPAGDGRGKIEKTPVFDRG
jgi:hypothetical protein